LTHRITSHGFALNVTPQPIKWFDLILACGLEGVRATCLNDMINKHGRERERRLSVGDVAKGLIPRLEGIWGRKMVDLGDDALEGEQEAEVNELREMCDQAERDAERMNVESGGWPDEPVLSRN
jgi:lipoate-protein ligase B